MRSYHCRDLQRWSAARAGFCHSSPGKVLMSLTFTDDLSTWPSTSNHVFRAPDELWCRKDTDSEHGLVLRYCKWSQVHGSLTCLRYSQGNVLKCYSGSKSRRNHFTAWILFWACVSDLWWRSGPFTARSSLCVSFSEKKTREWSEGIPPIAISRRLQDSGLLSSHHATSRQHHAILAVLLCLVYVAEAG